jgi:hypothetical protein
MAAMSEASLKAALRMQKHGMGPGQIAEVLELPLKTVFRYLQAQGAP